MMFMRTALLAASAALAHGFSVDHDVSTVERRADNVAFTDRYAELVAFEDISRRFTWDSVLPDMEWKDSDDAADDELIDSKDSDEFRPFSKVAKAIAKSLKKMSHNVAMTGARIFIGSVELAEKLNSKVEGATLKVESATLKIVRRVKKLQIGQKLRKRMGRFTSAIMDFTEDVQESKALFMDFIHTVQEKKALLLETKNNIIQNIKENQALLRDTKDDVMDLADPIQKIITVIVPKAVEIIGIYETRCIAGLIVPLCLIGFPLSPFKELFTSIKSITREEWNNILEIGDDFSLIQKERVEVMQKLTSYKEHLITKLNEAEDSELTDEEVDEMIDTLPNKEDEECVEEKIAYIVGEDASVPVPEGDAHDNVIETWPVLMAQANENYRTVEGNTVY